MWIQLQLQTQGKASCILRDAKIQREEEEKRKKKCQICVKLLQANILRLHLILRVNLKNKKNPIKCSHAHQPCKLCETKKERKRTNKNETNYLCGEIFALFLR